VTLRWCSADDYEFAREPLQLYQRTFTAVPPTAFDAQCH